VGLSLGGVEYLKGTPPGIEGYAIGRMTKSRRGKLYIDDSGWGPEAGSIEYGYRVPFGKIHMFIGKLGGSEPEPDICADIIEPARRVQPARAQAGRKHVLKKSPLRCTPAPLARPSLDDELTTYILDSS
jgi:hypothetical protein